MMDDLPDSALITDEPWRELRVGDKVRIVRVPSDFLVPGAQFDAETLHVFRQLVAANAILTIAEIDDFGHPWTEHFELDVSGVVTVGSGIGHSLALADDSWERVTAA